MRKTSKTSVFFRHYLEVIKFPLSLSITISSMLGYIFKSGEVDWLCAKLMFSILFLACGSAALNNYQDRFWDRLLSRTRRRAIPSGAVPSHQALIISVMLILLGLTGLYLLLFDWLLPVLGLLAIMLYNFLYTPLKKYSLWAIAPGMACGSIPPLLGWLAAGGPWNALEIWLVMAVFALWQIPHFWLILLAHYSDYKKPSIPNMLNYFSHKQLEKICFVWIMVFAILTLFFPLFRVVETQALGLLLLANAFLLIATFAVRIFYLQSKTSYQFTFTHLNVSLAIFSILLATEKLF